MMFSRWRLILKLVEKIRKYTVYVYHNYFSIRVGAHHRTKPNKWVQDLRVRQIYRHPKYNDPVMWANDVALLLLDRPAQFNSAVRPICLPDKDDQPGTDCTVTGWGRLSHSGSDPDYLMQVNAPFKVEHILLLI